VDVAEPASLSAGIAARYASALFELAREDRAVKGLAKDVDALHAALAASADLRAMIASPLYSRDAQGAAIRALAERMGLSALMSNTLGLMAAKRRLFVLPQFLAALRAMIAAHRGEVTAEVTSAQPLSAEQAERLAATLKERFGKTVKIKAAVDPALIGGLVVRVGSKMIDTSIRARLAALQNVMKEV
jgi:F-type H+-transporting ATPase subunit delta